MLKKFYDNNADLYGYMDEVDNVVILPAFVSAEDFHLGFAEVGNGTYHGLINETGMLIIPFAYDPLFMVSRSWIHTRRGDSFFLFSREGELVLKMDDLLAWNFPEEGFIRIKTSEGWGTVDLKGKTCIPAGYKSLGPLKHGWFSFFESNKWGWVTTSGNVVVAAVFDLVGFWSNQLWWGLKEGRYLVYNFKNELVKDEGWLRIVPPGSRGGAVRTAEGWQFVTEDFTVVKKFQQRYDWVEFYNDGMAAIKVGQYWGFINEAQEEVIAPVYKRVGIFSEGLAAVQKEEEWGYTDQYGEIKIPFCFRSAGAFRNGKAQVEMPYMQYYIDKNGKAIGGIEILD